MLYNFDNCPIIATDYEFIAASQAHVVPDQNRQVLSHRRSKDGVRLLWLATNFAIRTHNPFGKFNGTLC